MVRSKGWLLAISMKQNICHGTNAVVKGTLYDLIDKSQWFFLKMKLQTKIDLDKGGGGNVNFLHARLRTS